MTVPSNDHASALRWNVEAGGVRLALPAGLLRVEPGSSHLVVWRRAPGPVADWLGELVAGRPSYVISGQQGHEVSDLVASVVATMADRVGPVLVVELWTGPIPALLPSTGTPRSTVATLRDALPIRRDDWPVHETPSPPAMAPLLDAHTCRRIGAVPVGVQVPADLPEEQRRDLARGMDRAIFEFAEVQTHLRRDRDAVVPPEALDALAVDIDRRLAAVAGDLHFLLAVTPVDLDRAWEEFEAGGHQRAPRFHYRPLITDPDLLLRRLYDAPIEQVSEPTVSALLRAARHDLDRRISLLRERDTDRFLPGSLQLYGGAGDQLLGTAQAVLDRLPPDRRERSGRTVTAEDFAGAARAEIARYRAGSDATGAGVQVRDDVPGVLVDEGRLLVGRRVRVAVERVDALLQHEVGTHIVTFLNGRDQPLALLRVGLPGYEETQEGLAVLAEYLAGGLDGARLALLAGRVVAVRSLQDGGDLPHTYRTLNRTYGFTPRRAFDIATRVHRGGGLTKDAIYLRGFQRVLDFAASGGELDALFAGKFAIDHVVALERLRALGVLPEASVRPRWLDGEGARHRLAAVRRRATIIDIAEEGS